MLHYYTADNKVIITGAPPQNTAGPPSSATARPTPAAASPATANIAGDSLCTNCIFNNMEY